MENTRLSKIGRLIQKELALFFQQRANDFFLGSMISATNVRVSPDLSHAKVYVSIFPVDKSKQILDALELNARHIRHELSLRTRGQLRKLPELQFFHDDSLDYAQRIDELLKK